jgi:predicted MFS family arabinose efflux permease
LSDRTQTKQRSLRSLEWLNFLLAEVQTGRGPILAAYRASIVSILVVNDRTQGTGHFNLAAGSLATMVGIGAALSTTIGGVLIQHFGCRASFLGLSAIALLASALHWFAIPETLSVDSAIASSQPEAKSTSQEKAFAQ